MVPVKDSSNWLPGHAAPAIYDRFDGLDWARPSLLSALVEELHRLFRRRRSEIGASSAIAQVSIPSEATGVPPRAEPTVEPPIRGAAIRPPTRSWPTGSGQHIAQLGGDAVRPLKASRLSVSPTHEAASTICAPPLEPGRDGSKKVRGGGRPPAATAPLRSSKMWPVRAPARIPGARSEIWISCPGPSKCGRTARRSSLFSRVRGGFSAAPTQRPATAPRWRWPTRKAFWSRRAPAFCCGGEGRHRRAIVAPRHRIVGARRATSRDTPGPSSQGLSSRAPGDPASAPA